MTLGCGGYGGNITSDNISPRHLLNIKRLAYELRPAGPAAARPDGQSTMPDSGSSLRPAVPERVRTLDAATLSTANRFIPGQPRHQAGRDDGRRRTGPWERRRRA